MMAGWREGGRQYFLLDFKEYMEKELNYSRLENSKRSWEGIKWVFWNRQDDDLILSYDHSVDSISDVCASLKIRLNIRHALQKLISYPQLDQCLVQFWAAAETSEGRTLLTNQFQPFALGRTHSTDWRNQLCEYKMGMCREYNSFYADAESGKAQLGLPGRVFLSKLPEHNLEVKHCTLKEYPQRDLALRCQIIGSWGAPVFEQSSPTCVGVLEIACNITHHRDNWHDEEFLGHMYDIFQEFGLRCFDGCKHCKIQDGGVMSQQVQQDQPSMDAINNGMYVNSEAQNDNLPSLDSLQNGKVTTQVDSSYQPSMDASSNGQNVVTAEQNILVVPSSKERKRKTQDRKHKKGGRRIDIPKEEIQKCSHMNREDAAGKLKVGISTFKRVCRGYGINRWPPRNIEKIQPSLPSSVENRGQTPQLNFDFPSNQDSGTQDRKHKKGGPRIDIPKEEILKCSHMNLEDAAGKLGIGTSTFLRVCMGHGIDRWPPRNIEKIQPSLPSSLENQRQTPQLNFDFPSNQDSGTQDRKHKKGGPRIDIPKKEILKCSHMNQEDATGKLKRLSGGQQTLFSPLRSQDLQSAEGEPSIVPITHNRGGVKVTFSKPSQMNDHHVDVVKTEIYDDMRHDIGELKHTMISMNEKIMNWEKKSNAPGDGVDTRQQIGELKDVVYNLHQVIMKHIVRPDQLAAANEGVKAANKIGATAKTKIAHNLMSGKNNGEESDGPSIEFLGVKERALKKGRKGQVIIKEKEANGSPPAEHSLPILGSQRGRGRGGAGGRHGRGRGHTKPSLMHATTQSVDMGDTSSCNDDYVAPITRSEEERRPAPCVRSPYFADGVKKVQKVNQVQTTSMLTDDEEDVAVANMGKFLDNILKPSNEQIIPQSPLIEKTSPSTFLTSEEEVMVKFIFDENCIQGESVITMGLHFTNSVEIGTRQHMCCLKPYAWICTTVINLVVIQLTNKQRTKYPDGRHRIWYMSEYASQMIIKNEEYEGNNKRVADLFFKNKGYTGPIDACEEIYIPFNHNKDHWLCLKIDMVQHATYLFDSKPSRRFGEDRKKMGELLLENMHEVLKHAYGLDYVQDVSLFKVDWLSEQPLQFDEDNYDCGLFVIKYMQSAPLLPGFQKFDPIERRRLLVDLLKDVNNKRYLEFRIQFDMYNMRDSRMNAILQGDKASMPGIAAKKCVPFRKRGKK